MHFTPDNGYEQLSAYLQTHIPAKRRVAMTTAISKYLGQDYTSGSWGTIKEWQTYRTEYVVLGTYEVATGYGTVRPQDYIWLTRYAIPVFSFEGHNADQIVLYQIPQDVWDSTPATPSD